MTEGNTGKALPLPQTISEVWKLGAFKKIVSKAQGALVAPEEKTIYMSA